MGCVASKLEEEEVVSICKERKKQLKIAVERRYALAEAHCKYFHSLYAVAAAINLFVACHSSSSSFLITLPPPCPSPSDTQNVVINNPMFLQQTPFEPKHEAVTCDLGATSTTSMSESSEEEREEKGEKENEVTREEVPGEQSYGYYYMHMPMASPQRDFEWDFFNPFMGMRTEVISGYSRNSDDDLKVVREEEGIPELEEEGEREDFEQQKVVTLEEKGVVDSVSGNVENVNNVVTVATESENQREQMGLTVSETPEEGRELLEALRDVEDYFVRAYNCGKNVTRMLEANRIPLQSGLEEIKENSIKLVNAITWHRLTSKSSSSSCKSLVVSDGKSSSTWTEYKNDLFDDYEGMESGSHSLTLGRLYAWEKKLYEEVKAGDITRKNYEKKCAQLRNKDVRGVDVKSMDKTRAAVKDLYAGILVAIRRAESIAKRIEKIRDEELQPQIVELLKGLSQTWEVVLECHETQRKILSEVKSFTSPMYGKFCNESRRLATVRLEAQLRNWHVCFRQYMAAQKLYVEALHGWLSKFVVPEVEFYSRSKNVAVPYQANGPPLLVVCYEWLASLQKLPDEMVTLALKSVVKDVRALWHQQGEEQQQKRKVDNLSKDMDRRHSGLNKVKSKMLELQVTDQKPEVGSEHQEEYTMEKKDQLEALKKKLEMEKEKHQSCMQETQRITLHGLQLGFSQVFESLTEFSKASRKVYNDLVTFSENADKGGVMSYIEGYNGENHQGQT